MKWSTINWALLPFIVWGGIWIWWWGWGRVRDRAGMPRRQRWPTIFLVGGPQPRGQAALVDESVQIGQDIATDGEVWRVTDIEQVGASARRAWLLNVSEQVRDKIELAQRARVAEDIRAEIELVVEEAMAEFWGAEPSPDMPDILNHHVRRALCHHADRLRWLRYGVKSHVDLPPRALWPLVVQEYEAGRPIGYVRWDVRPMAEVMARRAHR